MPPSYRILIIDDESFIRATLGGYLEDYGHTTAEAADGREGLEKMVEFDPECVLVDLQMPRMSGLEFIRRVAPEHPELPIIVVSGANDIRNAMDAISLGAWDYLTKPIEDMHVLGHAINKAMDGVRLKRENEQYREHLEEMVQRRTQELEETNEKLQASLTEKVVLLKEIHHRVKNNLQIVSSLLALQAASVEDSESLVLFEESRSRINSMALLHEELYQSNDLARIDFQAYVNKLGKRLLKSLAGGNCAMDIHIPEQVFLPLDSAIPCGLLINELVTNAIKHAFPDHTRGTVRISLTQKDGQVRLEVGDDGVGFPQDVDFRQTSSLGMQLVVNLTEQIFGEVEMQRNGGTLFVVSFPLSPPT